MTDSSNTPDRDKLSDAFASKIIPQAASAIKKDQEDQAQRHKNWLEENQQRVAESNKQRELAHHQLSALAGMIADTYVAPLRKAGLDVALGAKNTDRNTIINIPKNEEKFKYHIVSRNPECSLSSPEWEPTLHIDDSAKKKFYSLHLCLTHENGRHGMNGFKDSSHPCDPIAIVLKKFPETQTIIAHAYDMNKDTEYQGRSNSGEKNRYYPLKENVSTVTLTEDNIESLREPLEKLIPKWLESIAKTGWSIGRQIEEARIKTLSGPKPGF